MRARATLVALCSAASLSPILSCLESGVGGKTLASAGLVLAAWFFLLRGLRRDPDLALLRGFLASPVAVALACAALVLIQVVGFALSGPHAIVALVACWTAFLALWWWSKTPESMASSAGSVLLLCGSLSLLAAAGEGICRLPAVVARTGGNTPGTLRWERESYDRQWETNRLRFRSFHLDSPKPAGTLRVVTLGDSFTWGDKIAKTEDVWPYVLERELRSAGARAEVVNLAIGGYTTVNEAESLRRYGWMFEPDLVVLQFYLNDTLPSGPGFERTGEEWLFETWPLVPGLHGLLDSHSYFYSFLNRRFQALQIGARYPDGYGPLYADGFSGWQASQDALRDVAEETRRLGVPLLVVLFPSFSAASLDEDEYPYAEIHRKVLGALDRLGVPALDLRPVYAALRRPGRDFWALPSDSHPGVEAHRIAGAAVLERLRGLGWPAGGDVGARAGTP
jgi:hypothetical protein